MVDVISHPCREAPVEAAVLKGDSNEMEDERDRTSGRWSRSKVSNLEDVA